MNYRLSKGTTEHYSSFAEAAAAFGCRHVSMKTKDANKLKGQQEKFSAKHKCSACGNLMELVMDTNIFTCKNPGCKGIKHEYTNIDGEKKIRYEVAKDLLDDTSAIIANNIFS